MTTVLLLRHGETTWHEGNRHAGPDILLTPRGHRQTQDLAAWAHTTLFRVPLLILNAPIPAASDSDHSTLSRS